MVFGALRAIGHVAMRCTVVFGAPRAIGHVATGCTSQPAPTAAPSVLPWVIVGGDVVFPAGGFYLWKLRGDQIDALDELGPEQDRCPIERAGEMDDAESKGKTYTALAFAGWGVGAAAITVGTVMLLGSSSKKRATAEWAPVIGPGFSGASGRGRF